MVSDKSGSAIDILANFIKRENKQHDIDILNFHPKRPDEETVKYLKENWQSYDLIHWAYWKSWKKARELISDIDKKVSILSHFNPYDVAKETWSEHTNVCCLQSQQAVMGTPTELIRLAVDHELWEFKPNTHNTIGMCANRIESKKGIKEVAEIAKELGVKFIIMGRISDPKYWQEVLDTEADIEFHESVPFEEMPSIYHSMGVYVVNSVDNFETGPMPPMEAMMSGVPVISRKVGTMAEVFEDGKSILFFDGKEEMKANIKELFDNHILRDKLREEGWRNAKNANAVRFAREYNKLYHKTLYPNKPLVSIIMPYSPDRVETIEDTVKSITKQTYKNIEILVGVDDQEGYNLAKVRNDLIVKSCGEYLLFLDDRWKLKTNDTVEQFVKQLNNRDKHFLWGDKGSGRRKFVENFSFTKRQDFINAGMWNQQIDKYGGMSQEIRNRLRRQGWEFKFCEKAHAEEKMSSRGKWRKKSDILASKIKLYKMGFE